MATIATTIVKSDEGVGYPSDFTSSINIYSIPGWYRKLFDLEKDGLVQFAGFVVLPKGPNWNMLVKLSWRVTRHRSVPSLVPDNVFVRSISSRIFDVFRFGLFIENVSGPRIGKTAGTVYGLVKVAVLKDLQNYVILYVVPNRRLALTAFKYVLGGVETLYRELRLYGVKITRGELYSKIRVRLYLGGDQSCLLNRSVHYVEDCIKSCPLFKKYSNKWKKLPPVPVLDNYLLKFSGYCPFISINSKNFWYKSLVVLTFDSLGMAIKKIEDFGIRNVIIVFDEYVYLLKKRGAITKIDVGRAEKVFGKDVLDKEFEYCVDNKCGKFILRDVLEKWNELVDKIDKLMVERYEYIVKSSMDPRGLSLSPDLLIEKLEVPVDFLNDVYRYLLGLYRVGDFVEYVSKYINSIDKKMKFKRLGRWMKKNVQSLITSVEKNGEKGRICNLRWTRGKSGKEYIVGWVGGRIRGVVHRLLNRGRNVTVITTSVDDSNVYGLFNIVPHEKLDHVMFRFDKVEKFVRSSMIKFRNDAFVNNVENGKRNDRKEYFKRVSLSDFRRVIDMLIYDPSLGSRVVVVSNKFMLTLIARELKRYSKIEVHGDLDRGVIDYVIVRVKVEVKKKKEVSYIDRIVLLVSPHSRVSMGIDPPLSDPNSIIILYGIRRPACDYIKVPRSYVNYFFFVNKVLGLRFDFTKYRSDCGTYYVVKGVDEKYMYLFVYDLFDLKFDLHMLVQVVGRWFMQNVEFILFNRKYYGMHWDIRYYAIDVDYLYRVPSSKYYYVTWKRRRKFDEIFRKYKSGEIDGKRYMEWLLSGEDEDSFGVGVKLYVPAEDVDSVVQVMLRGTRYIDVRNEVLRRDYYSLKNVYNSLRYIKKQLRYRDLHEGDVWLLVRKIVTMLRGFEYAENRNLDVPAGLKKFYSIYVNGGVSEMLEEMKKWLGISDDVWGCVLKKLMFYYNINVPLPVPKIKESLRSLEEYIPIVST